MARLLIKTEGLEQRTLELRLGVNRVGRDPDCDICIDHPTISTIHCELALTDDGVYVRDCHSTNGTFVNGEPVRKRGWIPARTLKLGDVELLVESTDVNMAIPQFERRARSRRRRWCWPMARFPARAMRRRPRLTNAPLQ